MKHYLTLLLVAALALSGFFLVRAQAPTVTPDSAQSAPVATNVQTEAPIDSQLAGLAQDAANLQKQQNAPQDQDVKKQLEILQKQIETQQKMIQLLMKQVKDQPPPGGAPVQKLEVQVATLEARSVQAAQRYQELAQGVDNIVEHQDAVERYAPRLPWTLKQLFDPFDNNATPLTISGALSVGYSAPQHSPAGFSFNEFSPDFFIKLNDWIFMEAEISVGSGGAVEAPFAQVDFIVNDWLTVVAGKFVAPIGWFNERLNNPWINKLPSDPLTAMQVAPAFSMLGVQARGAFYLGCSPVKMEYALYVSNGLNLTPGTEGAPTINELANIAAMTNTENIISNEKTIGGRIGLWYPEAGVEVGLSGMTSGDYVAGGFEDSISLWAVDANYHKCNWDLRAEYAMCYQNAASFAGTAGLTANTIRRQGFYAQAAYRPRDAANKYLQNTELVYRYGYVNFKGIDPTALDPGAFDGPVDLPVRRQQNEIGINYYFYPRMVLKCAYQVNDEPGFHLHDNQFLTELAWGW